MSVNAIAGVGTVFQRNGVALAEVNSIGGPTKTRNMIDVTDLDSADGYMEFIAGFRDGGEISLGMNYTRASYDLMNADFESNIVQTYKIIFPDTNETEYEFSGFVSTLAFNTVPDDKISMDASIKITGKVTQNS